MYSAVYSVQCTGAGRCPAETEDRRIFSAQVREGVAQGGTFANMWRTLLSIEDYREAACDDKAVTMVYRSLVVSVHCRWRNCARAGGSRGSGGQAGDQDTACNTHTATHHHTGQYRHTAVTRLYLHQPAYSEYPSVIPLSCII